MSHISDNIVITRKPHKCFGCAIEFPKGTKMESVTNAEDGKISTTHWCEVCAAYWRQLIDNEEGIYMGELAGEDDYKEFKALTSLPPEQKEG